MVFSVELSRYSDSRLFLRIFFDGSLWVLLGFVFLDMLSLLFESGNENISIIVFETSLDIKYFRSYPENDKYLIFWKN